MKIKNYKWNGFGFPVIFEELPAIKFRGELVPDVDWNEIGKRLMTYICAEQTVPLSGNQVKFIRNALEMNLRDFAKFVGVKHQSVMRWEERGNQPAKVEAHIEYFIRIKVLRTLDAGNRQINVAMDQLGDVENLKSAGYRTFSALKVPERIF